MIERWVTEALISLWNFLETAAYWLAGIIGTCSFMLWIATHEKKFKNTIIVVMLGYVFIQVVGVGI